MNPQKSVSLTGSALGKHRLLQKPREALDRCGQLLKVVESRFSVVIGHHPLPYSQKRPNGHKIPTAKD